MRLPRTAAAVALALGIAAPAASTQGLAGAHDAFLLAWVQRSIPVAPTSGMDRWRCHFKVGNTVYFSTGKTESRAREKLRPYTDRYVYCFPLEKLFPLWG